MRRMGSIDAAFIYLENPRVHQHTLKISIADPVGDPKGYSFARTKHEFRERLHLLPPYRWRMLPTPLGIHHPMWVDDPDFDFDYHVRRMAVPAPGGQRELCEMISEIASRPLDHSKPLWEMWLLEGLADGQVAAVSKVHHALADGLSSVELLESYASGEGAASVVRLPGRADPPQLPGRWQLIGWALADVVRQVVFGFPALVRAGRAARARRREERGLAAPPKLKVPKTPFNRPLTPHRSFAYWTVPLADVKEVRAAFGVTINDVVLATASGALRRYLEAKDALPEGPLVAAMPASTRTQEQRGTWGNRLTSVPIPIRTDIGDPVERLRACHAASQEAKRELRLSAGARQEDWAELFPPFLLKLIGKAMTQVVKSGGSPLANVVVSNVPGPREPVVHHGSPVTNFVSVGPLVEGIGLNLTVWSYVDRLNFGLIACRESVPDLWALAEHLEQAFDELRTAAAAERAQTA